MKTDIEIAQEAVMEPIKNVAARCGISEDDLELYGSIRLRYQMSTSTVSKTMKMES